ncbi:MAG TPA: hypothetical protein VGC81_10945 [Candidatus Methylomirabilis sp.]
MVTHFAGAGGGGGAATFSGASVVLNAAEATATGTFETLSWAGTEEYDTDAYHDAGAPTLLTIPSAGYYRVIASITWTAGGTGRRLAQILVDGTGDLSSNVPNPAAGVTTQAVVKDFLFAGGEDISVRVQSVTEDAEVATTSRFQIEKLGE